MLVKFFDFKKVLLDMTPGSQNYTWTCRPFLSNIPLCLLNIFWRTQKWRFLREFWNLKSKIRLLAFEKSHQDMQKDFLGICSLSEVFTPVELERIKN